MRQDCFELSILVDNVPVPEEKIGDKTYIVGEPGKEFKIRIKLVENPPIPVDKFVVKVEIDGKVLPTRKYLGTIPLLSSAEFTGFPCSEGMRMFEFGTVATRPVSELTEDVLVLASPALATLGIIKMTVMTAVKEERVVVPDPPKPALLVTSTTPTLTNPLWKSRTPNLVGTTPPSAPSAPSAASPEKKKEEADLPRQNTVKEGMKLGATPSISTTAGRLVPTVVPLAPVVVPPPARTVLPPPATKTAAPVVTDLTTQTPSVNQAPAPIPAAPVKTYTYVYKDHEPPYAELSVICHTRSTVDLIRTNYIVANSSAPFVDPTAGAAGAYVRPPKSKRRAPKSKHVSSSSAPASAAKKKVKCEEEKTAGVVVKCEDVKTETDGVDLPPVLPQQSQTNREADTDTLVMGSTIE